MNIHVGNMSPRTSLPELRECFEVFGSVTDASISTFKFKGKFKVSGSIKMPSTVHGQEAVAGLQDRQLNGSLIIVHEEAFDTTSAIAQKDPAV